jgi:hypothetical protein
VGVMVQFFLNLSCVRHHFVHKTKLRHTVGFWTLGFWTSLSCSLEGRGFAEIACNELMNRPGSKGLIIGLVAVGKSSDDCRAD